MKNWRRKNAELQRNAGGIPVILLGEHIANGPYDHVGIDNVAAARDATAQLIGLGRRRRIGAIGQPPDAVFCYNDLLAIGAMRTILNRGLRVPDDIAVVGFDDIEESRYSFPSLTTISPDKHEIARLAVAQLFKRLKGDSAVPVSHHVEYRLVTRIIAR